MCVKAHKIDGGAVTQTEWFGPATLAMWLSCVREGNSKRNLGTSQITKEENSASGCVNTVVL